jgi:predicted metalloprotease with PDZ domain
MRISGRLPLTGVFAVIFVISVSGLAAPITLKVDATDVPRKIYHAELNIPATSGPLTLMYPKWIPGEHAPSGPITDLAGLKISAGGKNLEWKRDSVELFAFHIVVPPGASSIDIKLDFLSNADADGFRGGASATSELAVMNWNHLLLYPAGKPSDEVEFEPQVRLPAEWQFGTALPVSSVNAGSNTVLFKNASMTTLVDSPVLMGRHFRRFELSPGSSPPHYLDAAADNEESLDAPPELIEKFRKLVKETRELFGATHYRKYHFLLALSDRIAHFGLEHHESSDNQTRERFLVDAATNANSASLLPHEFVHSWNGKYRRPDGLATGDFEKPMKGDLLWIYEGLTEYYGWVLAARSGLITVEQNLQALALAVAPLDNRVGREWRPLADTAVAAQLMYEARSDWESLRRSVDFYDEGALIWLEADTVIRSQTKNRKSLDDFCRAFYGAPDGPPQVRPYTLADVTRTLNGVLPYDWNGFFDSRVNKTGTYRAPTGGLTMGGYELVYRATPTEMQRNAEQLSRNVSAAYSIGLRLRADGSIIDVLPERAAAKAGIGPGMKVTMVNGRAYSAQVFRDALRETANGGPFELLVVNGEASKSFNLDYHEGAKYPVLERNGQTALLDDILKPRTP